jgi:pyridoxal phosphate enzyme (YggS family)
MSIATNIKTIKDGLPKGITLVAVSKTKPIEDILEAYDAGHRIFGENKVQELTIKYEELPKDIEWHYIGHLQSNKIKYITPFVSLIHGVDSKKLLLAINKEGKKVNRIIKCLFQFHIAQEETKFGFSLNEAAEILKENILEDIPFIEICGVMGMATYTNDQQQIAKEFRHLHDIFQNLKSNYFSKQNSFEHISMGMSGDYPIAIKEGSTLVRVGSSIFGARNYTNK